MPYTLARRTRFCQFPEEKTGYYPAGKVQALSIRKLFASGRGLFANGGKSIMMGTHCLHCQSQRRADGSQAQVDTRKHDSLGCQAIRRSRLRRFGRRHCQGSGQADSFRRREAAQGKSRFVGHSEHWCCNQRRLSIKSWQIRAAFTWTESYFTTVGVTQRNPYVPRYLFSFDTNYSIVRGLTIGIGSLFVGQREGEDFAFFPARFVEMGDYWLLRVYARWELNDHDRPALRNNDWLSGTWDHSLLGAETRF